MPFDNYIFSVLSAKKADFIILALRHSPQLRGLYLVIKTIVAYFYSAFAFKRRGTWINKPFLLIMQLNGIV